MSGRRSPIWDSPEYPDPSGQPEKSEAADPGQTLKSPALPLITKQARRLR